jgi:hypothetical protein
MGFATFMLRKNDLFSPMELWDSNFKLSHLNRLNSPEANVLQPRST